MKFPFKIIQKVQFSETDMAGIVHFSNYLKYMEAAESELFSKLKIPLIENNSDFIIGWPRVNVSCDFQSYLKFNDFVEISLLIEEVSQKSIKYQFEFNKIEENLLSIVGNGKMVIVYSIYDHKLKKLTATKIPEEIITKLKTVM